MSASTRAPPGFHARGTSGAPSGRLGEGEKTAGPLGAEPAPVLAVCSRCRSTAFRNPTLRITFCRLHGFDPFVFVPLAQRRL